MAALIKNNSNRSLIFKSYCICEVFHLWRLSSMVSFFLSNNLNFHGEFINEKATIT